MPVAVGYFAGVVNAFFVIADTVGIDVFCFEDWYCVCHSFQTCLLSAVADCFLDVVHGLFFFMLMLYISGVISRCCFYCWYTECQSLMELTVLLVNGCRLCFRPVALLRGNLLKVVRKWTSILLRSLSECNHQL